MTFNVQGCTGPADDPNAWSRRRALNVGAIVRHAPDLIGFQEVQQGNLEVYREHLAGYDYLVGNAYGNNPPTEHTSIFWRAVRFDLAASGEFWLSRTPDAPSCSGPQEWARQSAWLAR